LETNESNESAFLPMLEAFDNPNCIGMRVIHHLHICNFDFRIHLQELFSF
jgi:hypothetical protein